jgi:hypothetical protein
MADWDPEKHPRDKASGEFVERTSALIVEVAAENQAIDEMRAAGRTALDTRYFEDRDRLVAVKMRQLLEPAEYKAWFNEKVRRENAKMRRRLEFEQRERDRRRHRTYRAKFPGRTSLDYQEERIRTVDRGGKPVRVRVQSRALSDQPYRTLVPTRFQPGRRPR